MSRRKTESTKDANTLRRILANTPKLTQAQRKALQNAISLLEARAIDAEQDDE